MPTVEEQGTGRLEFGGFPFSNQDVFSMDVTIGDVGDEFPWLFNDPDGVLSAIVPTDGEVYYSLNGDHSYKRTGSHTFRVVCIPEATSISDIVLGSRSFDGNVIFDISDFLSYFSDSEIVRFRRVDHTGTATASNLDGLRVWNNKGGNADFPVSNFSIAWESFIQNFRAQGGLTGDWGNVSGGKYSNLIRLDVSADGTNVNGTLSELASAAPNLEVVRSLSALWDAATTSRISDLHNLSNLRRFNNNNAEIEGSIGDWGSTNGNGDLYLPKLKDINHKDTMGYGGEIGNLPSQIEKFAQGKFFGTFGDTIGDVNVTFDSYNPSDFPNFSLLLAANPHVTHAGMDVWWAQSANGASHLNGQSDGAQIRAYIKESVCDAWGWDAMQHPFRALEVKSNVEVTIEGDQETSDDPETYDPKANWNPDWSVTKVVGLPDSSTITVERASENGDTDASTPIPADGTLAGANGGSGAELHIFESTNANETGPHAEADSKTVYIVASVTDNGDGTLTIYLDTSSPSVTDTGSAGFDANTRTVVTW